jgi:hypothetical protein
LRIAQRRLILEQLRLRLRELHLIRTRINHRQQIAFVHGLSFAELDLDDLAIHPASHADRVESRYRPKSREVNRKILLRRRCHRHRYSPRSRGQSLLLLGIGTLAPGPRQQRQHYTNRQKNL